MAQNSIPLSSEVYVKVGGSEVPNHTMTNLIEVVVDQHAHLPDMFTVRIFDPDLELLNGSLFDLTKEVEISSETPAGQKVVLVKGEITAVEPSFSREGAAELMVRGFDKSHRFYRQVRSRTFLNAKDSEIASTIAREYGLQAQVDATATVYEHIYQHNQTDLEFLLQRAWRIGYECFVSDGKLYFRKPAASAATATLTWKEDLLSFSPRMTLAEQVDKVVVRGWDPAQQKAIVGNASSGKLYPQVEERKNGAAWAKTFGRGQMVIVDHPVISQAEANALASARLDELSGAFIQAEGVAFRRPDIQAGKVVALQGLGNRFSGKYLVTNAVHVYSLSDGFETTFTVRGTRTGLVADEMTPRSALDRWFGVVPAVVTNNKDPQNMGRVKVKYPWLDDSGESNWARVVSIGGGPETGFFVTPAVNDEVLVAFEHGDFNRPFILGGLWSGKNKAVPDAAKVSENGKTVVRAWRCPNGQAITMYDSNKDKRVEVKTAAGHTLTLDDTNKKIVIKSKGGHTITLDDQGRKVVVESKGAMEIRAGGNVQLKATGNMDLKATGNMNLKANGQVNVKGAMINLN